MSLKAGRVGVALDQVDEFGNIKSEATSGYTKQEADAKFETKTNATTEYAKLQPKTLSVPISMLQGSSLVPKTTVEAVIQTMDNAMTNRELTDAVAVEDITSDVTINTEQTAYDVDSANLSVFKCGKLVVVNGIIKSLTFNAMPAGQSFVTILKGLPLAARNVNLLYSGNVSSSDNLMQIYKDATTGDLTARGGTINSSYLVSFFYFAK